MVTEAIDRLESELSDLEKLTEELNNCFGKEFSSDNTKQTAIVTESCNCCDAQIKYVQIREDIYEDEKYILNREKIRDKIKPEEDKVFDYLSKTLTEAKTYLNKENQKEVVLCERKVLEEIKEYFP